MFTLRTVYWFQIFTSILFSISYVSFTQIMCGFFIRKKSNQIPNEQKTETTISTLPSKYIASAEPYSYNFPTNTSCVNWNQYYTNCSQLGGNPFQSTISFDNIGMVSLPFFSFTNLKKKQANEMKTDNENLMKIAFIFLNFRSNFIRFPILINPWLEQKKHTQAWVAIFLVISLEGWTEIMVSETLLILSSIFYLI